MATKKRKPQEAANRVASGEEKLFPVERMIIDEEDYTGEFSAENPQNMEEKEEKKMDSEKRNSQDAERPENVEKKPFIVDMTSVDESDFFGLFSTDPEKQEDGKKKKRTTKKRKPQDDEGRTDFSDEELDFRRFSRAEQKEMCEFVKNFFADPKNFEDLKDPWDEEEE